MAIATTSRCVYCGSPNFGSGCRYSPQGKHLHPDDPKKCSYCGSTNYGKGCRYSPDGIHIHGIQYNGMLKEQVSSVLNTNVILHLINKPIESYDAYKLGIIDEQGMCIRKPVTTQEHNSYTLEVKTLLQLKKSLGTKIDVITSKLQLEATTNTVTVDQYKLSYYDEQIQGIFNDLTHIVEQALADGIPSSLIFNCIASE